MLIGVGMKKAFLLLASVSVLVWITSCTTSQQSSEEDQIYVFDQIPKENTIELPETGEYPNLNETYYVVQIGAFTTKDRAESFADLSKNKIKNEIDISYNDVIKLYVVQITPFYKSKREAEMVRDELRKNSEFADAWIVTVNK